MGIEEEVVYPGQIESLAEVELLLRALGVTRVDVSGFRAEGRAEIDRLVAAIEPTSRMHPDDEGNSVVLEHAGADEAGWAAVATLARHCGGVEISCGPTSLRMGSDWADLTVDGSSSRQRNPDRGAALRTVQGLISTRSFSIKIGGFDEPALAALRFLIVVDAVGPVRANLSLPVAVAVDLAGHLRSHPLEWTFEHDRLDWPSGKLFTHRLLGPSFEHKRSEWLARIDHALQAGSRAPGSPL